MIKITQNLLEKLYYAFVFFLLFMSFLLFVYARSDRSTHPIRLFNVKSGSMEPKISEGDLVITYRLSDYKVGSVITLNRLANTFTGQVTTVTHRIVAKDQSGTNAVYLTKGDTNEFPDRGLVHPDDIVGRVYFAFPFIGSLLDLSRTTMGKWVFIFVPAGLIVLKEVLNIAQMFKKR